jgi:hypothetical protein
LQIAPGQAAGQGGLRTAWPSQQQGSQHKNQAEGGEEWKYEWCTHLIISLNRRWEGAAMQATMPMKKADKLV